MPITLIYTRTDKWLISKQDVDWKAWSDKLYHFMTSLEFGTSADMAAFLKKDFALDDSSEAYIITNLADDYPRYELAISPTGTVEITPLSLNLLDCQGSIIDWIDWSFVFSLRGESYRLWVYVGGIAEHCREIELSPTQIISWREMGNSFIRALAEELKEYNSTAYAEAQSDRRHII